MANITAKDVAALRAKTGLTSRVVELSLTQRANPFLLSRNDRDEAIEVGKEAVIAALHGETGKMIVMKRVSNKPYIGRFELAEQNRRQRVRLGAERRYVRLLVICQIQAQSLQKLIHLECIHVSIDRGADLRLGIFIAIHDDIYGKALHVLRAKCGSHAENAENQRKKQDLAKLFHGMYLPSTEAAFLHTDYNICNL